MHGCSGDIDIVGAEFDVRLVLATERRNSAIQLDVYHVNPNSHPNPNPTPNPMLLALRLSNLGGAPLELMACFSIGLFYGTFFLFWVRWILFC